MVKVFVYCDVDDESEHLAAIDSIQGGKVDLSRVPSAGEELAIKNAMFEVVRVIHRSFDEEAFDASVELKPSFK